MNTRFGNAGRPLRITLHSRDNVAIVVNAGGLPAGTTFDDGLALTDDVPQGHKVATADIALGGAVIRYGETIGRAVKPLRRGSWVNESAIALPEAPSLDCLPLATRVPPAQPPLEGHTFQGYRNDDGSVGTRNILAISTSVQCVAGVVDLIVPIIRERLLPNTPTWMTWSASTTPTAADSPSTRRQPWCRLGRCRIWRGTRTSAGKCSLSGSAARSCSRSN